MITKQKQLFYFVGDKPFASLEEAQATDISSMIPDHICGINPTGDLSEVKRAIACWMIANSDGLVDTLTTTPRSRLRARKIHGGTRKARKTKPLTEEQKATA